MNTSRSLRQVVGGRVRHLRDAAGKRQDDVADAARLYGLAWPRSRVAELEAGRKSISAEELILLPSVLSAALGQEVTLADLFASDETVSLAATTSIAARSVRAELCDQEHAGTYIEIAALRLVAQSITSLFRRLDGLGLADLNMQVLSDIERSMTEADSRAARKLGEPPIVLGAVCNRLWGRTLSAERDIRVGRDAHPDASARTVQAKRGRVTRDLLAEVRAFIDSVGEQRHG